MIIDYWLLTIEYWLLNRIFKATEDLARPVAATKSEALNPKSETNSKDQNTNSQE